MVFTQHEFDSRMAKTQAAHQSYANTIQDMYKWSEDIQRTQNNAVIANLKTTVAKTRAAFDAKERELSAANKDLSETKRRVCEEQWLTKELLKEVLRTEHGPELINGKVFSRVLAGYPTLARAAQRRVAKKSGTTNIAPATPTATAPLAQGSTSAPPMAPATTTDEDTAMTDTVQSNNPQTLPATPSSSSQDQMNVHYSGTQVVQVTPANNPLPPQSTGPSNSLPLSLTPAAPFFNSRSVPRLSSAPPSQTHTAAPLTVNMDWEPAPQATTASPHSAGPSSTGSPQGTSSTASHSFSLPTVSASNAYATLFSTAASSTQRPTLPQNHSGPSTSQSGDSLTTTATTSTHSSTSSPNAASPSQSSVSSQNSASTTPILGNSPQNTSPAEQSSPLSTGGTSSQQPSVLDVACQGSEAQNAAEQTATSTVPSAPVDPPPAAPHSNQPLNDLSLPAVHSLQGQTPLVNANPTPIANQALREGQKSKRKVDSPASGLDDAAILSPSQSSKVARKCGDEADVAMALRSLEESAQPVSYMDTALDNDSGTRPGPSTQIPGRHVRASKKNPLAGLAVTEVCQKIRLWFNENHMHKLDQWIAGLPEKDEDSALLFAHCQHVVLWCNPKIWLNRTNEIDQVLRETCLGSFAAKVFILAEMHADHGVPLPPEFIDWANFIIKFEQQRVERKSIDRERQKFEHQPLFTNYAVAQGQTGGQSAEGADGGEDEEEEETEMEKTGKEKDMEIGNKKQQRQPQPIAWVLASERVTTWVNGSLRPTLEHWKKYGDSRRADTQVNAMAATLSEIEEWLAQDRVWTERGSKPSKEQLFYCHTPELISFGRELFEYLMSLQPIERDNPIVAVDSFATILRDWEFRPRWHYIMRRKFLKLPHDKIRDLLRSGGFIA